MDVKELRAWRKSHGLTQKQLAERLGVSRPTVNRWEAGAQPAPEKMLELACCQIALEMEFPKLDSLPGESRSQKVRGLIEAAWQEQLEMVQRERRWAEAQVHKKPPVSYYPLKDWMDA